MLTVKCWSSQTCQVYSNIDSFVLILKTLISNNLCYELIEIPNT